MSDKNEQNPTLSGKQLKAIPVILSCSTIAEGCRKARICRDTFYSWMQEPDFKSEYERQSREIVDEAFRSLKLSGSEAVEVLRALLKAENENVRLRTATAIIESISKAIELNDIEKRIEILEGRIKK